MARKSTIEKYQRIFDLKVIKGHSNTEIMKQVPRTSKMTISNAIHYVYENNAVFSYPELTFLAIMDIQKDINILEEVRNDIHSDYKRLRMKIVSNDIVSQTAVSKTDSKLNAKARILGEITESLLACKKEKYFLQGLNSYIKSQEDNIKQESIPRRNIEIWGTRKKDDGTMEKYLMNQYLIYRELRNSKRVVINR